MDKSWGFDIETNQLSPFKGEPAILTASLWQPERSLSFLLDHPLDLETTDFGLAGAVDRINEILRDPTQVIVGHNLVLFDVVWWEQLTGCRVKAKLFDTRVAQALIDENEPNSLADLAVRYLGRTAMEDMKGMRARLEEVDPAEVLKYNIDDSMLSWDLFHPMKTTLIELDQWDLFLTYMHEYRTLADMTLRGVRVDDEWIIRNLHQLGSEEETLNAQIQGHAGVKFNIGSPVQLRKILYEDLRFPVVQQTKTGLASTSAPALRELRQSMVGYPEGRKFLDLIIKYREIQKMRGTYLQPYLDKHQGNDGRIHPTVYIGRANDGGTRTGRLSMSNPNLQNVPRDPRVKGSFIPTEGMELFDADYAQVELRVAAFLAKEEGMLASFRSGRDIHTATLADIERLPYIEVVEMIESGSKKWKKKRTEIKAVNFLILYGGGPYQLVSTLRDMGQKTSLSSAKATIDKWFKQYWRIAEWVEEERQVIVKTGEAVNLFGQVRHLDGASFDDYEGQKKLRQGINFLVQSVAAKLALLSLPPLASVLNEVGGHLLLTVHDSIVGEYPASVPHNMVEAWVKTTMGVEAKMLAEDHFDVNLTDLPLAADVTMGLGRWA